MTEQFRAYFSLRWAVVDFALHAGLAISLPGKWWFQYMPDVMLPVLFVYSTLTNRLLRENHLALNVHKFFHKLWIPILLLTMSVVFPVSFLVLAWLGVHWLAHCLVDQLTHPQEYFKKELL